MRPEVWADAAVAGVCSLLWPMIWSGQAAKRHFVTETQAVVGLSRSHRNTVLRLLLLAIVTIAFFHRVLFHPDQTLWTLDIPDAHSEYKFVQWRSFADWGVFPLWDPTIYCGKSIVGDSLPAVLNVPQWLFWLTPSPVLFGWILWFYATIGAWGMFLFARKKGCDPQGATLAAVVFILGGKTAGHLFAGHLEVLATMLCLPWIMLAAERVLEKPSFLRGGVLGATLALASTCGSVQIIYWHFLFVAAYAGLWLLAGFRSKGWPATRRAALAFAAGILSFLVFAAPWWFPIVRQTLLLSARARGTDYQFAASFSPQYSDLLHLIWPFHGVPPLTLTPVGRAFWERTLYFGVVPLALIPSACLCSTKNRSGVIIAAFLTALSFLLALGDNGPLFWLAARAIPGFEMFRCPGRLFFYTAFSGALLVGLFASEGGAMRRKWILPVISGALLPAVIAGTLLLWQTEHKPIPHVWLPIVLLTAFTAATLLWLCRILPDHLWKAAVLLLACCDLFVVWQDHMVVAQTQGLFKTTPAMKFLTEQKQQGEFRLLAPKSILDQTCAARLGLEIAGGYHPGISGRYFDLYRAIWKSDRSTSTLLKEHSPQYIAHPVILDLMNVRYLLAVPTDRGLPGVKALEFVTEEGGLHERIYRRDSALPRVCIVPKAALPAPGVSLLDAVCSMDPRAGCLVEDRPFSGGDAFKPLPFERQSPSSLTTRFTSEKGGVVVVSQAWHPDWRATDHGRPVELRRVNYNFVGVCVGPGDHELRIWYRPWDFYLGCWVAAASWTVLAVAGVWAVRQRRRSTKAT